MLRDIIIIAIFMPIGIISCKTVQIDPLVYKFEDDCQEYLMKGYYEDAQASCSICVEYGTSAACYNALGVVAFIKNTDTQKAAQFFKKAIKIDNTYAQAYNNLGLLYHLAKNYNKAISYYKKALRIAPDYFDPRYNLSETYQAMGDYDKAIEELKKAQEVLDDI